MTQIRRAVPNVQVEPGEQAADANRAFYGTLGFEEVMNLGWVTTLASPSHPAAQLTFLTHDATAPVVPDVSVELGSVQDVDTAYETLRASGAEIVHPLSDEDWGVHRFFVRDPQGRVVNVLAHREQGAAPS
ncbi:VOC family protein [Streptomyces sp. NPDC088785]|uniref:VOC family protein n=1 Tax=Streptomyces sp. NPDC088785 TaxID=3365897 RepID=UPI003811CB7D